MLYKVGNGGFYQDPSGTYTLSQAKDLIFAIKHQKDKAKYYNPVLSILDKEAQKYNFSGINDAIMWANNDDSNNKARRTDALKLRSMATLVWNDVSKIGEDGGSLPSISELVSSINIDTENIEVIKPSESYSEPRWKRSRY